MSESTTNEHEIVNCARKSISDFLSIQRKNPLCQLATAKYRAVKKYKCPSYIMGSILVFILLSMVALSVILLIVFLSDNSTNPPTGTTFSVTGLIFLEINVTSSVFVEECLNNTQTVICLTSYLESISLTGTNSILLTDALDNFLNLQPQFSNTQNFKNLISTAKSLNIGIYLVIPAIVSSVPSSNMISEKSKNIALSDIYSQSVILTEGGTCIDPFVNDIIKAVKRYSKLGVIGYLLNDLPCCVKFSEYYNEATCTYLPIKEIRTAAVNAGAKYLSFRLAELNSTQLLNKMFKFGPTYFDAIVRYIIQNTRGIIILPTYISTYTDQNIQDAWQLANINILFNSTELINIQLAATASFFGEFLYFERNIDFNQTSDIATRIATVLQRLSVGVQSKKLFTSLGFFRNRTRVGIYIGDTIFFTINNRQFRQLFSRYGFIINFSQNPVTTNITGLFPAIKLLNIEASVVAVINSTGFFKCTTEVFRRNITINAETGLVLKARRAK